MNIFELKSDEASVRELIDAFYKAAGEPGWNGNVDDEVAKIFTQMLLDAQKCLSDYSWALRFTEEPVSMQWLAGQIDKYFIDKLKPQNEENTCLEFVVEKWDKKLQLVSMRAKPSQRTTNKS